MPDAGTPTGAHSSSPAPTAKIDTSNRFRVARMRDRVILLTPPRPAAELSKDEALTLAAWLVAMAAEPLERPLERVAEIIDEITR